MKSAGDRPDNLTGYAARAMPRASVGIDNLRAVVIVMVLAFHAMTAYIAFIPQHPFALDVPPFLWRAFPIVDRQRFFGFDLFCGWLDVFLMSFFYLLSGLFVWSSLPRKGPAAFLQDRLLRLGLPFLAVVMLLMPLTLYPSYVQSSGDTTIAGYWWTWLGLPFWPSGPAWFLWLLILWDVLAAGIYLLIREHGDRVLQLSFYARAAAGDLSRRTAARFDVGLCPAGAAFRTGELVPCRPVRVPAQPSAAVCALFLRRRGARRLRHRTRPISAGRPTRGALGAVAGGRRGAVRGVGRIDGTGDP